MLQFSATNQTFTTVVMRRTEVSKIRKTLKAIVKPEILPVVFTRTKIRKKDKNIRKSSTQYRKFSPGSETEPHHKRYLNLKFCHAGRVSGSFKLKLNKGASSFLWKPISFRAEFSTHISTCLNQTFLMHSRPIKQWKTNPYAKNNTITNGCSYQTSRITTSWQNACWKMS